MLEGKEERETESQADLQAMTSRHLAKGSPVTGELDWH
jgi:hypothetical protein